MRKFYAVFLNAKGWSLTIRFHHEASWASIEDAAHSALAAQPEHERHGPWEIYTMDVCA